MIPSADSTLPTLLDATIDTWDRSNRALTALIRGVPLAALNDRALPTSPTIAAMAAHLHHERMVSVAENVPECAVTVPTLEWADDQSADTLIANLNASAICVRDAVIARIGKHQLLDRSFAHPIQLLHFLMFHDAYHHGQMKLALKANGHALDDEYVGVNIWDVWRAR
jgi:hypothetical protein